MSKGKMSEAAKKVDELSREIMAGVTAKPEETPKILPVTTRSTPTESRTQYTQSGQKIWTAEQWRQRFNPETKNTLASLPKESTAPKTRTAPHTGYPNNARTYPSTYVGTGYTPPAVKKEPDLELVKIVEQSQNRAIFGWPEDVSSLEDGKIYQVFTRNHRFEVRKNLVGLFALKKGRLADPIRGLEEAPITDKEKLFEMHLPKIPKTVYYQIVNYFRAACELMKKPIEIMVLIYWDLQEKKYYVDIPKQDVTAAHIKYFVNEEMLNNPRYQLVMDVHSHNTFGAFFSGTDNGDEKADRVFGVIGELNKDKPAHKWKAVCGGTNIDIELSDVFEKELPAEVYPQEILQKFEDFKQSCGGKLNFLSLSDFIQEEDLVEGYPEEWMQKFESTRKEANRLANQSRNHSTSYGSKYGPHGSSGVSYYPRQGQFDDSFWDDVYEAYDYGKGYKTKSQEDLAPRVAATAKQGTKSETELAGICKSLNKKESERLIRALLYAGKFENIRLKTFGFLVDSLRQHQCLASSKQLVEDIVCLLLEGADNLLVLETMADQLGDELFWELATQASLSNLSDDKEEETKDSLPTITVS